MYLVVKQRKGYRAIPINAGDDWSMKITPDGTVDQRIILRINQKHYQLYSTRTMVWRNLRAEDLEGMCKEIVAAIYGSILQRQDLVDVPLIADTVEKRYRLKQQLSPKSQLLIDYIRVEHPDIIQINHQPPAGMPQEELPY